MHFLRFLWFSTLFAAIFAAPQQGKFVRTITVNSDKLEPFFKSLYNHSTIQIRVNTSNCMKDEILRLKWTARSSTCYAEYGPSNIENAEILRHYLEAPYIQSIESTSGLYQSNGHQDIQCGHTTVLDDFSKREWKPYPIIVPTKNTTVETATKRSKREESKVSEEVKEKSANTEKNEVPKTAEKAEEKAPEKVNEKSTEKNKVPQPSEKVENEVLSKPTQAPPTKKHVVTTVQLEAPYLLVVEVISLAKGNTTKALAEITVEMKSPVGYLSAHQYPLLTFYMVMCIVYSLYAVAWLIMSACNFRDLLRVQFWIGGVILLGMIEKAVFYSEYLSVNSTGESVTGAAKFAEVVSALKRALARMLVIIVSLGFGIVKPRLGPMLHRVIGVGALFFILAVVESLVRADAGIYDPSSKNLLFAQIPLAVLDSVICWWIFISLMQTMKTLRLRRNVVKLSLYRHFSNTIIFCVIASLIMIFYSFRYKDNCLSNWKELWVVDVAFWHLLFSVILLVIIILWRPNINNQRYAFSPLIDGEDEEDESGEPMLGAGATETIKMRGLKNAADPVHNPNTKAEDDLKWIEENIPQTVADAALPALIDSDEEVMTTKYEMNKME